ncbi:MAG TPA: RHS repeat-associated core domain-containing protein [Pyrinomonadaceae bacterium]|jgi:RHS repeat-associated protein
MRSHRLPSTISTHAFVKISLLVLTLCLNVTTGRAQSGKESQRGFNPAGSYALGDIETISMGNGNLSLNIPTASLPAGRGGNPAAGVNLIYNSKVWDPMVVYTLSGNATYLKSSPYGNWRYAVGYSLQIIDKRDEYYSGYGGGSTCATDFQNAPKVWKVRMTYPDGSTRTFEPTEANGPLVGGYGDHYYDTYPTGSRYYCQEACSGCPSDMNTMQVTFPTYEPRTYYSTDGTYQRLELQYSAPDANGSRAANWTLYLSDGGRVEGIPVGSTGITGGGRVYDRNNNYTEIQSITYNTHPSIKIVDQLGRYIIIEKGAAPGTDYIHTKGPGNVAVKWTVKWKTIYVNKTFTTGTGINQNMNAGLIVLDQIILPTQAGSLAYVFEYNGSATSDAPNGGALNPSAGWGELSAVTLPSGARSDYQYERDNIHTSYTWPVVQNHPVRKDLTYLQEDDGAATPTTESWLYSFSFGSQDASSTFSQMTAPDGGVSSEWFYNNTGHWNHGLAYVSYHPGGTTVERIWQQNAPYGVLGGEANPSLKTEFTTITNAAGGNSKTLIKDYTYDKNGNVTSLKEYDWVNYSSVPRDPYGNITGTGIPAGLQPTRVTTNAYYNDTPDASDITTDDPNVYTKTGGVRWCGATKSTELGSGSQTLARNEFFYDDATTTGNLTQQKSWSSTKSGLTRPLTATNSISVSNQYDAYGNRTLATDARGFQTQYVYGTVGTVTGLYPTQINSAYTQPVERTTNLVYDFYTGLVTRSTDADNNVATVTSYDVFGRPTLVQAADGKAEETQTFTSYSDAGRYVITHSDLAAVGDRKLVSIRHYDQLGRVRLTRQLEDPATESETDQTAGIKIQTRYSISGSNGYQLVSNPYRAATSGAATAETTMGWTRSKSDNAGRVLEVRSYSGSGLPAPWGTNAATTGAVTTAYDANFTTVTDQAGKVRRSMSDGLGRLDRVDEPNVSNSLGTTSAPVQPTDYTYDALSNLTQVSQGSQTRTFAYDSLSRLTSVTHPESGTLSYQYDANGNLTKRVDPRFIPNSTTVKITTTWTYDALNRPATKLYNDATPDIYFYYDAQTLPAGAPTFTRGYSSGRLVGMTYGAATASAGAYYGYDALGRTLRRIQQTDSINYQADATYNRAGALVTETYPAVPGATGRRVVTASFDTAGRLSSLSAATTGYSTYSASVGSINYAAHGGLLTETLGNNLDHALVYNSRLQPTQIKLGTDASPTSMLYLTYNYGATVNNGNVLDVIERIGTWTRKQIYTYDSLDRLDNTSETNGSTTTPLWTEDNAYDRFGNRWEVSGGLPSLSFNAGNNQINTAGYVYDAAGNLTDDTVHTYGYDAENRVKTVDAVANTYIYDGDGKRVKKYFPLADQLRFVYGVSGELLMEFNSASGALKKEYVYGGGGLLAAIDSTAGTQYTTPDPLGSTRIVTNDTGGLVSRHDYKPFGHELSAGDAGRTETQGFVSGSGLRQKFTGKERDDETNLDFFEARYYNASLGRFTSADPYNPVVDSEKEESFDEYLGQPQNWNRYVYVWNNPLKYVDPFGEKVYVVTYTYGNSGGDAEFERAARTKAYNIQNSKGFDSKKDTVLLKGVYKKEDFASVLQEAKGLEKQYGKVEQVVLYSHSGTIDGPVFHDENGQPTQFNQQELSNLQVNWSDSAIAKFYGCYTGKYFAQNFANAQGVPAYGYDRYAYFSSRVDKRVTSSWPVGPLYLIAADGSKNGTFWKHFWGNGQVYPMVRRDPAPKDKPRR